MINVLAWMRGLFKSRLPLTAEEFEPFCHSILTIYKIPNFPSYRRAIASMIMHLGPTTTHVPKMFFAKSIKKAMANEVAFHKIQQLKQEEQDLQKAQVEQSAATPPEPLDVTAA